MPPTRLFVLALVTVTSLSACARREPERRFELTGRVGVREAGGSRVTIAHDPVEGLMPAMSMPFEIRGGTPGLALGRGRRHGCAGAPAVGRRAGVDFGAGGTAGISVQA